MRLAITVLTVSLIVTACDSEAGSASRQQLSESEIIAELSTSGLPVTDIEAFDAASDPNGLLGRPGQYVIKVSWNDSRLADELDTGGTLEIFDSASDMQSRADYVESIGASTPMFLQWIFVDPTLMAVLRVGRGLTPAEAEEYETWLSGLSARPNP